MNQISFNTSWREHLKQDQFIFWMVGCQFIKQRNLRVLTCCQIIITKQYNLIQSIHQSQRDPFNQQIQCQQNEFSMGNIKKQLPIKLWNITRPNKKEASIKEGEEQIK
ncbi:unnamed protein product [Paramecium sonneborni]|uniref:Uncharacterized protein n=1 Tax=Paramecium sonneborni TaxID=65129 RepID=A0A8S1RVI8_9CILI|nr:unnamed protein product [Paramecium sonneborni]